MPWRWLVVCLLVSLLVSLRGAGNSAVSAADMVNESARNIPLAYEVDVVVVGGGTGAVSAAVAAAKEGAKVFLAAPHPYLGDDMTATLRLWLDEGEVPQSELGKRIYTDEAAPGPDPNRLRFTYDSDIPPSGVHRDTTPPSVLTDGKWANAATQSVQYDGNPKIVADLEKPQEIREVRVMIFRRKPGSAGGTPFDVQRVTVSASDDRQSWKQLAAIENDQPFEETATLSARVEGKARYVQFALEKPAHAPRMLLGEIEIVGTGKELPAATYATSPPPRPMHVKKVLDDALLEAGVTYLYSCYATDVLRDAGGRPCGIVMANRAGRQAVVGKVLLDATPRAVVARMAGADFRPYPPGVHTFQRVVVGGQPKSGESLLARVVARPFQVAQGTFPIIEYTLPLNVADGSYAAYMRADQQARTLTYDPQQQFTSDVLFEVPPDAFRGRESADGPWAGVEALPLGAFQPAGVECLGALGGCADVPRPVAACLLRPLAQIDLGQRLGRWAAALARSLPKPSGVHLAGKPAERPVAEGDVQESLAGVRPLQRLPAIPQQARGLPVLGRYDVVVIGGGTGGAPAGIGAARQGAKTLVVEYLYGLGGVGTLGAISSYYWGHRAGFTATIQDGATRWEIEPRMEWYRQNLLQAGGEVWFGTIGCGVFLQGKRVRGAVVATPLGRGVVLADTVIDATGNADVAVAAGAETIYTDASEFGMQGTGLPGRQLGGAYNNTDFTIVDETDMVDIWHVLVYSKDKYPQAFDHGQLIDTRERRRVVGDFVMTLADQINERTFPDSVVRCWSNFDSHGYTVDPLLLLEHPEKKGIGVYVPYRAMLPKGVEGMLVTGLSISAHRDAVPLTRMQPDIQNGGYAAGVAAAMAAKAGVPARSIDVRKLQQHLVEIGNLPDTVLADKDSYPLADEKIVEAVKSLPEGRGAAVIMTHAERALPLLESAYANAEGKDKLAYAKALAVLGNARGVPTLMEAVQEARQWDEGWNFRGMGQFGAALSPLDTLIVALGRARDPKAVPVILEKLKLLDADKEFSHHRAVGQALELIGDRSAAAPLAELLAKPGMAGHVHDSIEVAKQRGTPGGTNAVESRRESLRELLLARALYRCGDHNGLGEQTLRKYAQDLRGHLARHAEAVLEEGKRRP